MQSTNRFLSEVSILFEHKRFHSEFEREFSRNQNMAQTNVIKVVLLRHGESTWNQENRFTGWMDVPLAAKVNE